MDQKPSKIRDGEKGNPFIAFVFAGLGAACFIHSVVWVLIRTDHPSPDSFVGAEGMAIWSIIFMLIGLTLWIVERRS